MSTKIYDAYKIDKKNPSFSYMNTFTNVFRKTMTESIKNSIYTSYANLISGALDALSNKQKFELLIGDNRLSFEKDMCVFTWVSNFLEENQKHIDRTRFRSTPDFSCSMVLFYCNPYSYFKVYISDNDMMSFFKKIIVNNGTLVKDFHYQNQCDKPKGVSLEEWDEREKIWDKILEYSSAPSDVGMTIEIDHNKLLLETRWNREETTKEILKRVKKKEKRAKLYAISNVKDKKILSLMKKEKKSNQESVVDYMDAVHDTNNWITTEYGINEIQEEEKKLLGILPDINMELIRKLKK